MGNADLNGVKFLLLCYKGKYYEKVDSPFTVSVGAESCRTELHTPFLRIIPSTEPGNLLGWKAGNVPAVEDVSQQHPLMGNSLSQDFKTVSQNDSWAKHPISI